MSNQMEEIPEDVKKAAERAMEGWLANLNAVYRPGLHDQTHYMRRWVTDAIMAERERCAKVVERHRPDARRLTIARQATWNATRCSAMSPPLSGLLPHE